MNKAAPPPNYTQVPNAFLGDHKSKTPGLMADLSDAELRCLLVIYRCTLGWHDRKAHVSVRTLMKLTGLGSSHSVDAGTEGLMARGIIRKSTTDANGDPTVTEWELVADWDGAPGYANGVAPSATAVAPSATPADPQTVAPSATGVAGSATAVAPSARPSEKERSKERSGKKEERERAGEPRPALSVPLPAAPDPPSHRLATTSPPTSPDPSASDFHAMSGAICSAVGWDPHTVEGEHRAAVDRTARLLLDADYTPADVAAFKDRWFAEDWRGQKGEWPTLKLLKVEIGKLKQPRPAARPGQNGKNGKVDLWQPPAANPRDPEEVDREQAEKNDWIIQQMMEGTYGKPTA